MGEKGAYDTMKFVELSQEQRRLVFTQASAQTGINVNLAEKDWWICLVLASPTSSTARCSASPSSASPGERCTSGWQSWPCHHSEWKSYNKYVLFNTFIISQTIYC